jgi:hypothetical protein
MQISPAATGAASPVGQPQPAASPNKKAAQLFGGLISISQGAEARATVCVCLRTECEKRENAGRRICVWQTAAGKSTADWPSSDGQTNEQAPCPSGIK